MQIKIKKQKRCALSRHTCRYVHIYKQLWLFVCLHVVRVVCSSGNAKLADKTGTESALSIKTNLFKKKIN